VPTTVTPSAIVSNSSPPGILRYLSTPSNYKIYKIPYSRIFIASEKNEFLRRADYTECLNFDVI